jgi:hypothetical protein
LLHHHASTPSLPPKDFPKASSRNGRYFSSESCRQGDSFERSQQQVLKQSTSPISSSAYAPALDTSRGGMETKRRMQLPPPKIRSNYNERKATTTKTTIGLPQPLSPRRSYLRTGNAVAETDDEKRQIPDEALIRDARWSIPSDGTSVVPAIAAVAASADITEPEIHGHYYDHFRSKLKPVNQSPSHLEPQGCANSHLSTSYTYREEKEAIIGTRRLQSLIQQFDKNTTEETNARAFAESVKSKLAKPMLVQREEPLVTDKGNNALSACSGNALDATSSKSNSFFWRSHPMKTFE